MNVPSTVKIVADLRDARDVHPPPAKISLFSRSLGGKWSNCMLPPPLVLKCLIVLCSILYIEGIEEKMKIKLVEITILLLHYNSCNHSEPSFLHRMKVERKKEINMTKVSYLFAVSTVSIAFIFKISLSFKE